MSGPLGFGAGGGGGDAVREVIAGSGITTSGTATSITVVNDGVRSLSGSGISVSSATGAVTITAPTVSGGTGISVSGSGTTALTVSATGVQSISAGNGISISGTTTPTIAASIAAGTGISISGTTTLSVSATGVQSLTAGTGISVSGTTTPTVTNSGVTSIVAGTNVTVSGATGAVTINAPAFATPGSSAIGDTAAAGTATTVARSDHRHSREAFGTPVNIDASLTSLSAGSLTTVARADHVHTVSKVPVLIASTKLTSNQASVTFSNIPQTFTHLQVYIHARTTVTGGPLEELMIRVNGDTGSNYYGNNTTTYLYGLANTASAYPTTGAVTFTAGVGMIYNYANILGSYAKMWTVLGTCAGSTTALISTQFLANSVWNSTAAITSISFASSIGGSLVTGSMFELIGIP